MTPIINAIISSLILVFNWPKTVDKFISYAWGIHDKMVANARYTSLATKLGELKTAIENLVKEQAKMVSKPRTGNKNTRDALKEIVKEIIIELGASVLIMAKADLPNAETIITDAGFEIKTTGGGQKIENNVEAGPVEGSMKCSAAGDGPHLWRVSRDNIKFEIVSGSNWAVIILYGYESGELLYVQNGQITDDGREPTWSQSIKFRIP